MVVMNDIPKGKAKAVPSGRVVYCSTHMNSKQQNHTVNLSVFLHYIRMGNKLLNFYII
jgi:hypothetical protein